MNIEPQEFINDVIKAYAKTKLVPSTGRMFRIRDGNKCACALGVLYAVENNIPEISAEFSYLEVWDWAKKKFGENFVDSFWRGFDLCANSCEVANLGAEVNHKIFELYNKGELYG